MGVAKLTIKTHYIGASLARTQGTAVQMTNEMATNEEIMKDISGKFDSLKEDVEGLKSSGARVETPTASGANTSRGIGGATPTPIETAAAGTSVLHCISSPITLQKLAGWLRELR